jgi:hypothetical protein
MRLFGKLYEQCLHVNYIEKNDSNLQFLTPVDNMKKSDCIPEGFDFKSTLKKQLDLIAHIEKEQLTYQQVLEMQKTGNLYEVKGYEV